MTDQNPTLSEIKEACHIIAERVMRFHFSRHSHSWVKEQMLEILLNPVNIESLAQDYADDYSYADVQNPYLVEALKKYDQEA